MINFDSLTLSALLEELYPVIVNSRVHKVQQPSKHEVILTLRALGKNRKLCISAHPKYSYLALLDYSDRVFTNPQTPPMFCMLLRKHMEGAKIVDIKQPENERILEIYFESFNELGDRMLMTLACEIMGKCSNIILYITKTKLILGCSHNVGELMSSQRELAGGLPYSYPPFQDKFSLLDTSLDQFINMSLALTESIDVWLSKSFHNISLALAKELCNVCQISSSRSSSNINTVDKLEQLYSISHELLNKRNFKHSISEDKEMYSLLAMDINVKWRRLSSVNEMVDIYFAHHINKDTFKQVQSNLKSRIKREIKKISNKIIQLEESLAKAHNADVYRHKADLITANLHKLKTSTSKVKLENYYDNNNLITIDLDPALTPNQNAQKYYKLYNKAKKSLQIILDRQKDEQSELDYLESILTSIIQASELNILEEIQDELDSQKKNQSSKEKQKQSKQRLIIITTFLSSDNFEILVGRNNKQNDYLISKLSSPNDLWLHTQSAHGSHVIIKTDKGSKEIPEKTLHEAALLAGYFSEGRYSSNVAVVYTLKKNVKKPAGAKPGYVVYSNEKTLFVNPLLEHVTHILAKKQVV